MIKIVVDLVLGCKIYLFIFGFQLVCLKTGTRAE